MKVLGIYDQFTRKRIQIPQPDKVEVEAGDFLIYEDEENRENIGRLHYTDRDEKDKDKIQANYTFLRQATSNDIQKRDMYADEAEKAKETCQDKIDEHGLDMQLIFTDFSLDGKRINFIFTADDRVDFRELVKDLAKTFQKQIHLQQIGPRDKARIVCGRGKCGKGLCCCGWLKNLESITMDMVRLQCLESKGSAKLSGCCGKLMCCLRYEVGEYERARKELPETGSFVKTKEGDGKVISLDVINQKIRVAYDENKSEVVDLKDIKKVIKK